MGEFSPVVKGRRIVARTGALVAATLAAFSSSGAPEAHTVSRGTARPADPGDTREAWIVPTPRRGAKSRAARTARKAVR